MSIRFWPNKDDPDYDDPAEGIDEMSMEDLLTWLDMAETCATDPEVPARTRAKCDDAIRILAAEIEARQAAWTAAWDVGRAA